MEPLAVLLDVVADHGPIRDAHPLVDNDALQFAVFADVGAAHHDALFD